MWSLPDIQRLNSEAYFNRRKLERGVQTGILNHQQLRCESGKNCGGVLRHELWFDIFSSNPKGVLTQYEHHFEIYGVPDGFFRCEECDRLLVENYTWERYSTTNEKSEQICLRCAAEQYIVDNDNWIRLTDEDIAVVTFEVIRQARHVLAVEMTVPAEIRFFDGVTLDSATGGLVRSFTTADATPDSSVAMLREILHRAKESDNERAILIVDGLYQFAVSIGVYVPSTNHAKLDEKELQ